MRLDANLRTFIIDVWPDVVTRKHVVEALTKLPEPLAMMTVSKGSAILRTISPTTLIITEDAIGYGWPMVLVAWRRS